MNPININISYSVKKPNILPFIFGTGIECNICGKHDCVCQKRISRPLPHIPKPVSVPHGIGEHVQPSRHKVKEPKRVEKPRFYHINFDNKLQEYSMELVIGKGQPQQVLAMIDTGSADVALIGEKCEYQIEGKMEKCNEEHGIYNHKKSPSCITLDQRNL